ncbi:MAG: DUF3987 domain-containing protein [Oscillospiraceae bacterium]|nr:DUF3987 domain-containing protein [Oscillospiraceae bacterium]
MHQNITFYRANTSGNPQNCFYPHEVQAETEQQLAEALRYDHVFVKFEGNRRRNENFLYADLMALDCDNDHSENPEDWIRPEDLDSMLAEVAYFTCSSRHDGIPKENSTARPRFHVVFPIERVSDAQEYVALKKKTADLLPFFDRNALDAGRFFFGMENAQVLFHDGEKLLTQWLKEEEADQPPEETRSPIREGERNRTLHRFAVKALKRFGEGEESLNLFRQESTACEPPLPEEELIRIWKSACKFYRVILSQPGYVPPEEYSPSSASPAPSGIVCRLHWEEPLPLQGPELPPFPVDALPPTLADYVSAVAESLQIPPDMAAVGALGALSTSLQKKFAVHVNSDWAEPINLYLLVIADPSERKSPCIKQMIYPIQAFEQKWNDEHALEIESSKKMKRAYIRRVESLEKKVAEGKAKEEELKEAVKLEQSFHPKEKLRLFLDDVTPEKLTSTMAANDGVCSIMSAEGGIFETFAGRYSGSANFDVALKAFSGDPIRVDRMNRDSETIENPALTLLLMAQPSVLSGIMGNRDFRGKGLTARILYSVPKSLVGARRADPPTVPWEIREEYEELICSLLTMKPVIFGETELIWLSEGAEELRLRYTESIEKGLLEEYADLKDWAGKIVGTTIRIAGLLCLAESGPEGRVSKDEWTEMYHYEITEDQFSRAVRIAAYFIEHAKAVYSRISAEAILGFCRRAVEAIRRRNMRELNLRELQRACTFLKDAAEVQAVLDKLEECGYLIIRDQDQRNRPGRPGNPVYAVNPVVFGEKLAALPAPEE